MANSNRRDRFRKAFYQVLAVFAERTSEAMLRQPANGMRMGRRDRRPIGRRPDPSGDSSMMDDPEEQQAIAEVRRLRARMHSNIFGCT